MNKYEGIKSYELYDLSNLKLSHCHQGSLKVIGNVHYKLMLVSLNESREAKKEINYALSLVNNSFMDNFRRGLHFQVGERVSVLLCTRINFKTCQVLSKVVHDSLDGKQ